jgi:hypothetical protein
MSLCVAIAPLTGLLDAQKNSRVTEGVGAVLLPAQVRGISAESPRLLSQIVFSE